MPTYYPSKIRRRDICQLDFQPRLLAATKQQVPRTLEKPKSTHNFLKIYTFCALPYTLLTHTFTNAHRAKESQMPPSKSNSASASPKPLTPKEKKVYDFVDQFIAQNEFAPSYQEIKDHFGFASFNSVQRYLKQLQAKTIFMFLRATRREPLQFCSLRIRPNNQQQPKTQFIQPKTFLTRKRLRRRLLPLCRSLFLSLCWEELLLVYH